MKHKTAYVRDRLKIRVAEYEIQLSKARLRFRKGDAVALKRLNRLEDTLTLYKRILEQIERSAEIIDRTSTLTKSKAA